MDKLYVLVEDEHGRNIGSIRCDANSIGEVARVISRYQGTINSLTHQVADLTKSVEQLLPVTEELDEVKEKLNDCETEIAFKDRVFEVLQERYSDQQLITIEYDIQQAIIQVQEEKGCDVACAIEQSL